MSKQTKNEMRRQFLRCIGGLAAGAGLSAMPFAAAAQSVSADTFPARQIRVIIPFPPGGSSDSVGRMVSQALGEKLNRSVVVENRPGGGAMIGAKAVSRAEPDGYTLLFAPGTIAQTPILTPGLDFDASKDLAAISMTTEAPLIVVARPELPVQSMSDLIELARKEDGKLKVGYPGLGTTNHIALEMLKSATGIQVNGIPYPGNAEVAAAILRGEIDAAVDAVSNMRQHIAAGKVRGLAVTGLKRSSVLPDLPTVDESAVKGFWMTTWTGMFAPAGTPASIQTFLNNALNEVVHSPELANRFRTLGFEPVGQGQDVATRRVTSDIERTQNFVKQTGFSTR